jgi:hypothetical protein
MYADVSKKPAISIFKVDMAGLEGGPAGQPPGTPTYTLRQDVIEIIGNILLVNRVFHLRKTFFFRKLSTIWARALKNFRQPCPRPKKSQEYRFEGAPNYLLARQSHMSRADLEGR